MRIRLTALWSRGHSASRIVEILREEFPDRPKTRNSVLGAVHRMRELGRRVDRDSVEINQYQRTDWTPEMDDLVRELTLKKSSKSRIARALAPLVGDARVTRHLVKRRQEHLGLLVRARPQAIARGPRLSTKPMPIPEDGPVPTTAIPWLESTRATCRWPVNSDARELLMCGERMTRGAYCDAHARLAYRQQPSERRNAVFHRQEEVGL